MSSPLPRVVSYFHPRLLLGLPREDPGIFLREAGKLHQINGRKRRDIFLKEEFADEIKQEIWSAD